MSSPTDRAYGADDLSLYAPPWVREGEPERRVRRRPPEPQIPEEQSVAPLAPERADEGLLIDRMRVPRSLEPGFIPQPPALKLRSASSSWRRLGVALSLSSVIALIIVGKIPLPWSAEDASGVLEGLSFSSRFSGQGARPAEAAQPALAASSAELVFAQVPVAGLGEASPLGISLRNGNENNAVVIAGLPAGATLSAGYPYGAGGWRVPARELAEVRVFPPRGFLGQLDLAVDLRDPNDAVTDRRALRLEWAAPKIAASAAPPPAAPARLLDRAEIDMLIRRGEDYLNAGDISSARLMLKRAAEARDPRAAFALASTYDPLVLERSAVIGVAPDIGMARNWYEKAKEFGSAEAPRSLEMLASRAR